MFNKSKDTIRKFLLFPVKLFAKRPASSSLNFSEFEVSFNKSMLEFKDPEFQELNPTYVLIRDLKFHPELKLTELPQFENLIRWKNLHLNFTIVFRDYQLNFLKNVKQFAQDVLKLAIPDKIKSFTEKQINIAKKIKITEEILQVLPYTRNMKKQKLFTMPISRSPLYKSYFPESEIKRFREELAAQNKTRWSNVEILEIYDKFNVKIFSDIRQTSGSRNLLCYPSFSNADMKMGDDIYYLIVGRRRDTSDLIKALSKPVNI